MKLQVLNLHCSGEMPKTSQPSRDDAALTEDDEKIFRHFSMRGIRLGHLKYDR